MRQLIPTAALVVLLIPCVLRAADDEADAKRFNEKILPIFKMHCYDCHSAEAEMLKGKLRLDTKELLRKGGASGEIIKPGEPDESLLMKVLRYEENDKQMPPRGKLDEKILADFAEWIKAGAVDPRKE